jgi:gliding motility-associated lipoprotein GldH|tara:strand:+ start:31 stop:492 length:462 start_codon:yes stop_codon:yes gene_type:complete
MKKIGLLVFVVLVTFLISCDKTRFFDENIDFQDHSWSYENKVFFEISNTDEEAKKLFVNFRHSSLFPNRNVLLKAFVQNPKGEKETIHINIPLSEPNGKWYGDCSGDVCSIKYPIAYELKDTGIYIFGIVQDMRVNPLQGAISIGLRLEIVVE